MVGTASSILPTTPLTCQGQWRISSKLMGPECLKTKKKNNWTYLKTVSVAIEELQTIRRITNNNVRFAHYQWNFSIRIERRETSLDFSDHVQLRIHNNQKWTNLLLCSIYFVVWVLYENIASFLVISCVIEFWLNLKFIPNSYQSRTWASNEAVFVTKSKLLSRLELLLHFRRAVYSTKYLNKLRAIVDGELWVFTFHLKNCS